MQSQMCFLLLIIISGSLAGHDYRLVGLFEEDNYPKHQKPKGKPLKVEGELNLRNIQKVDDQNLCISLEITLRLFWLDERVKHNTTTQLEPLPRDPSTNKSYVLIKDS